MNVDLLLCSLGLGADATSSGKQYQHRESRYKVPKGLKLTSNMILAAASFDIYNIVLTHQLQRCALPLGHPGVTNPL